MSRGRPKLPDDEKAYFKKVSVRVETYEKIKNISKKTKIPMYQVVDDSLK